MPDPLTPVAETSILALAWKSTRPGVETTSDPPCTAPDPAIEPTVISAIGVNPTNHTDPACPEAVLRVVRTSMVLLAPIVTPVRPMATTSPP